MTRIMAVVSNALLLCLFVFLAPAFDTYSVVALFVILQLVLFASHVAVLRSFGQVDFLDGLNILNIGLLIHFTLAPVLIVTGAMDGFYTALWDPADIPRALILIQLVCVCVQAGYYARVPLPAGLSFAHRVPSTRRIWIFLLLVVGGIAVVGLLPGIPNPEFLPDRVASSGPVMALAAMVFFLPYVLLMLVPTGVSPMNTLLVVGGLLLVVLVSLFGGIGSKQGVTNVVFAWALHRHYFVRRLRLREALPVVLLGLGIVGYMNYARAGGMLAGLTVDTANPLKDENWGTFIQAGVASTLTPYEAFLVVLNTFPDQLPFQGGQRFFEDMVYPFFPRILFPDKPTVYGAAFFWEYHRGFLSLDRKIYEAVSLPGHLYLDFGVPGIVAVGLAMGAIQRAIYQILIARGRRRGSVCLYGMIISMTLTAARAFTWTTYTVITNILIPVMAVYAFHASTRRVRLRLPFGARPPDMQSDEAVKVQWPAAHGHLPDLP